VNLTTSSLAQMVDEVGGITKHTETSAESKIVAALNRALVVAAALDWTELEQSDETGLRSFADSDIKTLESGDSYYPGPLQVDRVLSIVPQAASDAGSLEIITAADLQDRVRGLLTTTGLPRYAAYVGQTIQHRAFTGPAAATVTNSIATMDNAKVLRMDYEKGAGYVGGRSWEDVDGTFSTGVALNATVQGPYGLRRLSVPAGWAGHITVAVASVTVAAVNTLEEPSTNTNDAHQVIARPLYRLWPVPDQDYACTVTWQRQPLRLTEDEDVPEVPVSPYLVLAAAADIFRNEDNNAVMAGQYDSKAGQMLRVITSKHRGQRRVVATPFMGSFTGQTGVC
jgi:hypothetical protein